MKLEEVTMEIRPRSDMEAMDSGFALVRRDFWRCLGLWWMAFLPMLLLLPVMVEWLPVWLGLAWWWKLSGCRMVVYQLSRRLFGEQPTWKSLWRELPRAWVRRFWYRMCWARFSPWKSISLVVEDLEGLRGGAFHTRMRMVMRRGEGSAVLLFFLSLVGTLAVAFGLMLLVDLFIPQGMVEEEEDAEIFSEEGEFLMPMMYQWIYAGACVVAASLVDVFLTGAGFGLYVNSRTWVEGWDVELAFKRLANRISGGVGILLMLWMMAPWQGMAAEATVAEAGGTPREIVERVKAHEDFTIHKVKHKVRKDKPSSGMGSGGPAAGLAGAMVAVGWMLLALLVGGLLALVVWLVMKSRLLTRVGAVGMPKREKARVVMGMEVTKESLPDDVVAAARRMWDEGRHLPAMGLLYRGALSWWIHHGGVEIRESDTEGDCLRRVSSQRHVTEGYFQQLTSAWMLGAYAEKLPETGEWHELCQGWPFVEKEVGR